MDPIDIPQLVIRTGYNPELLSAIIRVESGFDRWAVRYEASFSYVLTPEAFAKPLRISVATETECQKMSWGLMQIMGGTARSMGFKGPLPALLDPETNLYWGVKYLKRLGKKYGHNTPDQVAAYNAGSARKLPSGEYENHDYVVKVLGEKYV